MNLWLRNEVSQSTTVSVMKKIYIGKSALKVILSNVVGNAVKYSDTGGIIDIGFR